MFSKKALILIWVLLFSLPAIALVQDSVLTARSIKKAEKVKILPKDKTYIFHLTTGEKYKGKYQIVDAKTVKIIGKHELHTINLENIKQISAPAIGWKIGGALLTLLGGLSGYVALAFLLGYNSSNVNTLGDVILLIFVLALGILFAIIAGVLFLLGIPMFFLGHRYRSKRWKFEIAPES